MIKEKPEYTFKPITVKMNDNIWKFTPMMLGGPTFGHWVYKTWWVRFRGFLKTGKWPKKKYIPGLLDRMSGIRFTA